MADIKSNYNPKDGNTEPVKERDKKYDAVANGKRSRVSWFDILYKRFIKEDLTGVREPGILSVIIPAAKKTILDVINVFLNPNGKPRSKNGISSKISYRDYYGKDDSLPFKSDGPNRVAAIDDYDSIVFDTRGEAEKVLAMMDEIISMYKVISIADYYDICGIDSANYTANKYGWTDIRLAKIVRTIYNQYQIKLPKAIPLSE